jgi:hypothetical protein
MEPHVRGNSNDTLGSKEGRKLGGTCMTPSRNEHGSAGIGPSPANEPQVAFVDEQIWKLIRAYGQTAASFTIRSCFRKAGLSPNTQTRPFKPELNEEAPPQDDGLKELRDRNISVAELSRRQ